MTKKRRLNAVCNATIASSILLIVMILPVMSAAEDIKEGDTLTLDRCIEIALKRNPTISASENAVKANEYKVVQSKSKYYPQVDLSGRYNRSSRLNGASGPFNEYSSSISLNQNILDFGSTAAQLRVQKYTLESSRFDLKGTVDQITFNVKQAYYGVLQAKRTVDVNTETVKQFEQHLEQARGLNEVGLSAKIDVIKAEVDLSNARLNLIKAENNLKIARITLNNAIGITDAPAFAIEDNLFFAKFEIARQDAVDRALKNRPDLQSIHAQEDASRAAVQLARSGYYPSLSGNLSYGLSGENFPLTSSWSAGLTMNFPLFSGFSTKSQVGEAQSNLSVLNAKEESLHQQVLLEINQAYLVLQESEDSIKTAQLTVQQAEENLALANGRYAAGVGSPLEVTDALVTYSNAKASSINALYNYKIAQASIEQAMGSQ